VEDFAEIVLAVLRGPQFEFPPRSRPLATRQDVWDPPLPIGLPPVEFS